MEWSDHLAEMAEELDRLQRQASADEIHVSTRSTKTVVTLEYERGDDNE